MVGPASGFKIAKHVRTNTGTTADLSVSLAQKPGWLHGVQAFNFSSNTLVHLFLYDSSVAVTTATAPFWHGAIMFYEALSTGSLVASPGGAGFVWDNAGPIPLDNGFAYAVSGSIDPAALSTVAANLVVINTQFQTSTVG